MRTAVIFAHPPRLRVALLGGALLSALALAYAPPAVAGEDAHPTAAATPDATAKKPPDAATKKAARAAYSAGEKAYAAHDYTAAYDQFRKAHDLIATIHAEYWMAMSLSYGDDVATSYDALASVVGSPEASKLGEDKVASATARLEELKKTPASVSVSSTPPGAEVSVDGAAQPGVTPMTLSLSAGAHHVGVALRGYDAYEADVTVKPGQKLEQSAELSKTPEAAPVAAPPPPPKAAPPPAAPPPAKEERNPLPAYITLGVGGVGAIVGTIFGVQALSAKSDFNKTPTNDNADRAERDALIADMGFAVALTLGITGIVLLVSDDTSEVTAHETKMPRPVRARLDVAPMVTHTAQGAAARLTF